MRTIQQIIEEARAALNDQRASEQSQAEAEAEAKRQKNREAWQTIIEGLKPFLPAEIYEHIHFDVETQPETYRSSEWGSGPEQAPISITLPTPERYTVFGYYFDNAAWGFFPAVARDDEELTLYVPPERWRRRKNEVRDGETFKIALAKTMENWRPPTEAKPRAWNPPPTIAERLEAIICEIASNEVAARLEH